MKKNLTIVFILYTTLAFSQTKISGVITDSLGAPVSFAPIGLLSVSDSNLVKGSMTDEAGKYIITELHSGKYLLKVSATGYQEKLVKDILVDSATGTDLSVDVKLSSSLHTLGAVSVTAIKPLVEFKNGNVTVNVENSPLAKGNSVFDLLAKLPGVSIDNNKIMIQGKPGTIVLIDGRTQTASGDQLINLLKSMSADLVASIEILKNPPVKYDASGTSGMIDIKSKKVTVSGITGSAFTAYSQGFYEQATVGASLNYKSKKIIFYSNLSGDYGHYRTVENFKKKFTSDSSAMNLNTDNVNKTLAANLNYKVGLDWLLTKRDVIGAKVEGGPGQYKSGTDGRNAVFGDNTLGFDHLDAKITQPDNWNINNYDLNYDHKIGTKGSSFSMVTDYTRLTENVSSENTNKFYDANGFEILVPNNYRSENKSNSDVFSGRADLTKIIDSTSYFECGLKASHAKTANDYLFERDYANNAVYAKDTGLSNKFEYTELTYAAYLNYSKSFKKLSMQLGARLEDTYLTGENTDKNFKIHKEYLNVFPNFSFDYKVNDKHDFQLNFSRRIDRPNFSDLTPFMVFRDQYSFQQGNPFLLPDYANRAELSYNYKSSFSTSVAYSYIQNIIMDYTSQNDLTKVTMESNKNMKSCDRIEYSVFYQRSLTKKWDLTASGTFAGINYKGDIDGVNFQRTGITYYGNLTNNVLVNKNATLEIMGIYRGPNVFGVIQAKARWLASLALKMSLCKDKLDLTLGVDDIFHSFIGRSQINFENQNWSYMQSSDSRRFRISLNYTFGKMKIEERNVNSSNEEEKGRFNH